MRLFKLFNSILGFIFMIPAIIYHEACHYIMILLTGNIRNVDTQFMKFNKKDNKIQSFVYSIKIYHRDAVSSVLISIAPAIGFMAGLIVSIIYWPWPVTLYMLWYRPLLWMSEQDILSLEQALFLIEENHGEDYE